MDSEVGIHGGNGVDDISAGTADAPDVGPLAAMLNQYPKWKSRYGFDPPLTQIAEDLI